MFIPKDANILVLEADFFFPVTQGTLKPIHYNLSQSAEVQYWDNLCQSFESNHADMCKVASNACWEIFVANVSTLNHEEPAPSIACIKRTYAVINVIGNTLFRQRTGAWQSTIYASPALISTTSIIWPKCNGMWKRGARDINPSSPCIRSDDGGADKKKLERFPILRSSRPEIPSYSDSLETFPEQWQVGGGVSRPRSSGTWPWDGGHNTSSYLHVWLQVLRS